MQGRNLAIIRDQRFLLHQTGLAHPESPDRLKDIYRMLDWEVPVGVVEHQARPATLEQVELVHTPGYVQAVLATAQRKYSHLAPDTTASADSALAAFLSAGGCIQATDLLLDGAYQVGLSLGRPPGHHAFPDSGGGFCIFNNLSIAARYAMGFRGLKRVLIVDFDFHHGNGIQDIFYRDPRVFYLSSHHCRSWPHSGQLDETGSGPGEGYNLNLCIPDDLTDADLMHLYREILPQVVERFAPQLILVAAGFDAHRQDPIGSANVSEDGYAGLAELLVQVGPESHGTPLMLALEGGYDPPAVSASLRAIIEVITTGQRTRARLAQSERALAMAEEARLFHRRYGVWTD